MTDQFAVPSPSPSSPQNHLLSLIQAGNKAALETYLHTTLRSHPDHATYTSREAVASPTSAPALLLVAAASADQPEIFALLWDSLYLSHLSTSTSSISNTKSDADTSCNSDVSIRIPYPCLAAAARSGSIPLGKVFIAREPGCLKRRPPPAPHAPGPGGGARSNGSQTLTALYAGQMEYMGFMCTAGVELDHEWPEVDLLRTVVGMELSEEDCLTKVQWLAELGARVEGSGAIEKAREEGLGRVMEFLEDLKSR